MKSETFYFCSGALSMACFVVSLFFLKFWKRTKDRLFIYFFISFALLGTQRMFLVPFEIQSETKPAAFIIRILAFLLIAIAIVDKNRSKPVL